MIKRYRNFLSYVLALLGFAGCTRIEPPMYGTPDMYGPLPVEYGTPHADFRVSGMVRDENGQPLKGIRVAIVSEDLARAYWEGRTSVGPNDTLYSDASGKFGRDYSATMFGAPGKMELKFEDVDGAENGGEFSTGSQVVTQFDQIKKPDGRWYQGAYQAEVNQTLKKKED